MSRQQHGEERTSDSEDEDGGKRESISELLSDRAVRCVDPIDRDSGLLGSSKETESYQSLSSDPDGSDGERGAFDYFQLQSIKINNNCSPDFDEAHDVESDKSSVESPRSDASSTREYDVTTPQDESFSGTEMRTLKVSNEDFEDDCPSDGESCRGSQRNYSSRVNQNKSFQTSTNMHRRVDEPVKFFEQSYCRTSISESDNGYARKATHFRRDGKEIENANNPFGDKNQFANVAKSVTGLLSSTAYSGIPPNMPEGELLKEEGKKKPNGKKGSKDDSDEHLSERSRKSLGDDINGNRLDPSTPAYYRQMRDLSKTEGSLHCKQGNGTYNQSKQIDTSGHGQSDRDLDNSSSNLDSKKKRRRKSEEPVNLSENVPNYVGNKLGLDELLQFIGTGEKGEKQIKKKLNRKNTPESSVAKPDKLNKKNKDKKDKIKSFDSADDVSLVGEQSVGSSCSASICEDMGNSSEKPSTNTNEKNNPDEDNSTKEDNKVLKSVDGKALKSETIAAEDKNNKVNNQIDKVVASKCIYPTKKEAETKDKNKPKLVKEKPSDIQDVNKKVVKAEDSVDNKKSSKQKVKAELQVKNNKKVENMVIENGPSQVVTDRSNRDLSTSPNSSSFIFTDIDPPPPVEAEFTVVGKTKKKKRPPGEYPKHKNNIKEFRPTQPRSATPPPPSKEKSHDLSPSAFPVLANVNKCGSGRRNSSGDVPIDSGSVRSWDDSDIESVKSLPAAQGGRLADVASSRFPVSYAKMVSAPKPPNSPNSSIPLSPGSCDDDLSSPKTTIWKGSLHERRHSIGSSPEDTKPDTSPKFNQRTRQKSGSQDILKMEKMEALQMEVKVSDISSETLNDEKGCDRNLKSCADVRCLGHKPSPTDVVINSSEGKVSTHGSNARIPTITFTSGSSIPELVLKGDKLEGTKKLLKSIVSNTNETSRSHTIGGKNVSSSIVIDSSCIGKTTVSNNVNKDLSNKPTNVINNGRKPKSSVVFLDKRFIETPQNLDITFGFDSNLDIDNKGVLESDKAVTVSSDADSAPPACPVVVSVTTVTHDKTMSDANQSIHSSSSVSIGCVRNCKLTANLDKPGDGPSDVVQSGGLVDGQPSNSSNITPGKVSKSHIAGLNGVVQSHSQGYRNKPTSDALRTDNITSEKMDSVSPNHDTAVLVFYGDGIVAKIGDGQICLDSNVKSKQIKFVPDNNITANKFNSAEAIAFLKKEWDNIIELKEKCSNTVIFYNGQ
ncbi:uncharacterized protein LOC121367821 isoform X2 [Gigantopelta aegis]|nr:uncharacterized protein LOC121367821 isoform X2 [Gigantopelta aegis]XP_041348141.1 uncharacterized protein LOC121367821 isoform X2 [Gigantopelta aegis]XP_041348142.1 uncharacterized protein LOC121367821 isoform X2 [Gigantopelta aegis]